MSARNYVVRGRVQGVGYRYFAQRAAQKIGVQGFVRNLDDGNVDVYAVGSPEQLAEFAGLLWQGPRFAEVRGVDQTEAAVRSVSGFQIER